MLEAICHDFEPLRNMSSPGALSTNRTRSGHDDVALVRSFGAPGGMVAVEVGSEKVQRGIGAARIDIEVLKVVAHGERKLEGLG